MKVLAKVLTHSALVELAGERYFERGEQYHREGLARIFAQHDGIVTARVIGTHEYRVKLQAGGDELVAVKSRDLSRDDAYLEIADLYRQAGRYDEALEWAERGVREFPDPDPRLRELLAQEYRRRGRPEDAMEVMWEEFATRPHLENYRKLKSCTDRLEDWVMWRKKALDRVREQTSVLKGSRWFPADHSTLVGIFLWERRYDEAWREALEGGCSPGLWLRLAAVREVDHPEDAISVYRDRIEVLIDQKNKGAYREARDLILKVRDLMRRAGREPEFAAYLDSVRAAHRRKRNLMTLLEGIE